MKSIIKVVLEILLYIVVLIALVAMTLGASFKQNDLSKDYYKLTCIPISDVL